jgi:hypothetical protein
MGQYKARLEAERTALYARWVEALTEHDGCVSRAAVALSITRSKADSITRRWGLCEWAAELRRAATGNALGRQDR